MIEQDWVWGFVGGLMVGTGGAVYLLANGRIMGASGILGGVVDGSGARSIGERLSFIAGCVGMPLLLYPLYRSVDTHITSNVAVIVVGGLLVGVGTRLANGCTSGHGVCGISRLSPRGMIATAFYILAGGITVLLMRHLLGVI